MNFIKQEQLEKLQGLNKSLIDAVSNLGQIELTIKDFQDNKEKTFEAIQNLRKDFADFQKELFEEYGQVSVDLNDGSYKEVGE